MNSTFGDKYNFGGNREIAIKRDGGKCVVCGMTRQQHRETFGRDITVDHINGKGAYSKVKDNSLDNLQTLCAPCHGRKDGQRRANRKGTLTKYQVLEIRRLIEQGLKSTEISRIIGCGRCAAQGIELDRTWRKLTK